MKVKATSKGVYGSRRWKPGDEFEVDAHHFNASWMKQVEEPKAQVKRGPGRPKKQPKEETPSATEQAEV